MKTFCSVKVPAKKRKRQATEWEEIFANFISENRQVSEMYRNNLSELNSKKKIPIRKWARDISQMRIIDN